jgi:SAM-dependent methyltransferase
MDIAERVAAFPRWHYQFDLDGVITPIFDTDHINRHEQRRRYFFDRLVDICGGSLKGRRVLDLGCNAGYWSLAAIDAGCDQVVGIDGRAMHIEQANLVFEVKGVDNDRFAFQEGDLFKVDWSSLGRFDVVLCLGLLYHVAKPVELFEKIASVNDDLLVVDTELSLLPGSAFAVKPHESLDLPTNAVGMEMILRPTRQAVIDLAQSQRYETVVPALNINDWTGMNDYRTARRRALLCSLRSDLSIVPSEAEPTERATSQWRRTAGRVRSKLRR